MSITAIVTLMAVTLFARAQQAPPQPQVFRGGADTVAIYATVLDRSGEPVLNLDRNDFEVEDDGRRQDLTVFVAGLQPITATVLIDTSASMTLNVELAQAAAEQLVIRMLPGDKLRAGSFSDRIDLSKTFTGDRDELLRWIRDGLHIGNPTKLWDAVGQTMTDLAPLGGRKVIVLLTDGLDTLSLLRQVDILTRARSDELMIYVVQFRSTARANLAEVPLSPTASQLLTNDVDRNPPPTLGLRQLALQTGGGHFLLTQFDDLNSTFTHVMQELHYQYVLGFTPQKLDGKIHTLRVRVNKPNMTVRTRQSYRAALPRAPSLD